MGACSAQATRRVGRASLRGVGSHVVPGWQDGTVDAMPVLAALSDESSEVDVSVTVNAEAVESYDRTWVRNAIRERLEEAGITVEIVLGDD